MHMCLSHVGVGVYVYMLCEYACHQQHAGLTSTIIKQTSDGAGVCATAAVGA